MSYFLSAIFQLALFSLIPFIWWFILARKKNTFFSWVGLVRTEPENRTLLLILLIGVGLGLGIGWLIGSIVILFPLYWKLTTREESFIDWLGIKTISSHYQLSMFIFLGILITINVIDLTSLIGLDNIDEILIETDGFVAGEFYGTGMTGLLSAFTYAFIKTGLSEEILFRGFIGKRASEKLGFVTGNILQGILFGLVHGIPAFILTGNYALAVWATLITGVLGILLGYVMKVSGGSIIFCWLLHAIGNFIIAVSEAFS